MSLPCQPKSEPVTSNPSPEAATAKGTYVLMNYWVRLGFIFMCENSAFIFQWYLSLLYVSPLFLDESARLSP